MANCYRGPIEQPAEVQPDDDAQRLINRISQADPERLVELHLTCHQLQPLDSRW